MNRPIKIKFTDYKVIILQKPKWSDEKIEFTFGVYQVKIGPGYFPMLSLDRGYFILWINNTKNYINQIGEEDRKKVIETLNRLNRALGFDEDCVDGCKCCSVILCKHCMENPREAMSF